MLNCLTGLCIGKFTIYGFNQALRWKNFKAIRKGLDGKIKLYDLEKNVSESTEIAIADRNPDVVKRIEDYLKT